MGPIKWNDNFRITSAGSKGSPQTSHGPALAVFNGALYAVYVGAGGSNLWFMRLNSGAGFNDWQSNQQITIQGAGAPKSSYRPALAVLNGNLHMVYQGSGGTDLWWSWFDGIKWAGDIKLPPSYQFPAGAGNYSLQKVQPALCVDSSGTMHLVYHSFLAPLPAGGVQNELRHGIYKPPNPSDPPSLSYWSAPDVIAKDLSQPAVAAFGQSLSVTATSTLNNATSNKLQYLQGSVGNWGAAQPLGPALSTDGAVLIEFNELLYTIYRGQGHRNLWYTWMDSGATPLGNQQVKGAGVSVETSAPIGAAIFNSEICIAYKGQDSDNFWFCHGS
jgi:hypothetical protein